MRTARYVAHSGDTLWRQCLGMAYLRGTCLNCIYYAKLARGIFPLQCLKYTPKCLCSTYRSCWHDLGIGFCMPWSNAVVQTDVKVTPNDERCAPSSFRSWVSHSHVNEPTYTPHTCPLGAALTAHSLRAYCCRSHTAICTLTSSNGSLD